MQINYLEIKNLIKKFNGINVIDQLSLKIEKGDRIALLGQNGSGKTTLIRCLLGLYKFEGTILFRGINLTVQRKAFLEKIAFIPQLPPPLDQSLEELIELNIAQCHNKKENVYRIADKLGLNLNEHSSKVFQKLSGGMKQKFLLSLAISRNPDFLIMDEPTASLDVFARNSFYELLETEAKNATLILTSHRVDELVGTINRMIELDHGKIVIDKKFHRSDDSVSTFSECCLRQISDNPSFEVFLGQWGFEKYLNLSIWRSRINKNDASLFFAQISKWSHLFDHFDFKTDRSCQK